MMVQTLVMISNPNNDLMLGEFIEDMTPARYAELHAAKKMGWMDFTAVKFDDCKAEIYMLEAPRLPLAWYKERRN